MRSAPTALQRPYLCPGWDLLSLDWLPLKAYTLSPDPIGIPRPQTDWPELKDHFKQAGEVLFVDVYRYTARSKHVPEHLIGQSKVRRHYPNTN
eukprot:4610779-Pyramimonas_sp.AAC.1